MNGVVANVTTGSDPAVNGGSKTLREKPRERGSGTAPALMPMAQGRGIALKQKERRFKKRERRTFAGASGLYAGASMTRWGPLNRNPRRIRL